VSAQRVADHLAAANQYEHVASHLLESDPRGHPERAILASVALWHAAYHYTCAALVKKGIRVPEHHGDRRDASGAIVEAGHRSLVTTALPHVATAYQALYQAARELRYSPWNTAGLRRDQQAQLLQLQLATVRAGCT
jgi:hypothetical protein